ncbi:MAG: GtrA family protein [Lachnospiraceae bacterium]|nr:GtrA family protein [Lachnospiraceae bacterium]MBQ4069480.1 GtrA family protein [Lachnospiraceae bacterium]
MKAIYGRHREFFAYAGYGCGTVAINFIIYYICYYEFCMTNVNSNIVAWFMAMAFAFITNKLYVFESKSLKLQILVHELIAFVGFRVVTGAFDVMMMYYTVDRLHLDGMVMKAMVNVIVIALNYVASKKLVFKNEYDSVI